MMSPFHMQREINMSGASALHVLHASVISRKLEEDGKGAEINACKINKQMHLKHIDQLSLPQAR